MNRHEREAGESSPVYWGHTKKKLGMSFLMKNAIGGAISPSYMEIRSAGTIKERKHSNLIYTAIMDAVRAVKAIVNP